MTRRTLLWVAGPLLAMVLLALIGGSLLGPRQRASAPTAEPKLRQVYSPHVLDDPYFRKVQRRNLEALERACEERHQFCAEAAGAERAIDRGATR